MVTAGCVSAGVVTAGVVTAGVVTAGLGLVLVLGLGLAAAGCVAGGVAAGIEQPVATVLPGIVQPVTCIVSEGSPLNGCIVLYKKHVFRSPEFP